MQHYHYFINGMWRLELSIAGIVTNGCGWRLQGQIESVFWDLADLGMFFTMGGLGPTVWYKLLRFMSCTLNYRYYWTCDLSRRVL